MAQEVLSLFELCNVYFSSVIICIFQSHKRIICPSSLLVMKNRLFAVDEEHKLRVSETKATRKVFRTKLYVR